MSVSDLPDPGSELAASGKKPAYIDLEIVPVKLCVKDNDISILIYCWHHPSVFSFSTRLLVSLWYTCMPPPFWLCCYSTTVNGRQTSMRGDAKVVIYFSCLSSWRRHVASAPEHSPSSVGLWLPLWMWRAQMCLLFYDTSVNKSHL